ncbi:peptidylprolyl isomerase [Altericista sp. CCNU0014]|uniref:peptidylprolyl isomerase n=1 Tax=Altericista sp. CCNU0014 TaxID=3082949 RepID=UPI00385005D6
MITLNGLKRAVRLGSYACLVFGLCFALCLPAQAGVLVAALPPGNAVTDPRSLLRLALPFENDSIRQVQRSIEDITPQIRARRWSAINGDVAKATTTLSRHKDEILASVPESRRSQATELIDKISTGLTDLKSITEAKDGERLNEKKNEVLDTIGTLEASMVEKFPYEVPKAYDTFPQLKGRATVAIETSKGTLTVVADGYSAPVTAGNFVDLVQRGFYNGLPFTRSEESYVLQTGDPQGPEVGFVDPTSGKYRSIPMEILVQGDKVPFYGSTLEEAGRYLDNPVLPFSAYGAVAMAPPDTDPNGASSQFFFFLFEPELTPAGRNLLDGRYAVFGYVVSGQEVLGEIKEGDKIVSAKVVDGLENFVKPKVA